ncbi:MAG TPA: CRISPR-associated helicase Cas3' [Anaerolineae bacterium]|nr:CRISPR-associated helicase Cas3' [Anaerolineae bacterium]
MGLYPYQERVKELIQHGKSVILQAPTGAGKTRAALAPFIENFFDTPNASAPRKCLYVVPMRVLANQFVAEYGEHAASYERIHRRKIRVEIQTGEQPRDRRFEQDLTFCTIDQFLSSYLTMPFSLAHRLANLNAGALVGTFLVFDEFHLLDPQTTLPTVLHALKQFRGLAPMLLMTATFSQDMLNALADELSAQVEHVSQEEWRAIQTRDGKTTPRERTWRVCETELTAEDVMKMHRTRSIAICNTVRRAQNLFRELKELKRAGKLDAELLLLHSRFLQDDRQAREKELKQWFGKDAAREGSAIIVATQTIEVGVDITSEVLHTELAPASSMIQRAGRCARYAGEKGQVIVYPVSDYAPYGKEKDDPGDESPWVREMRDALDWLRERPNEILDFHGEQELINAVAAPRDKLILQELSANRFTHSQHIERVWLNDRQANDGRLLIRDADSRLVLLHSNPDELLRNPLGAVGFNVPTLTLYGMIKDWTMRPTDAEWRVKLLLEDKAIEKSDEVRAEYGWKELHDASLLWTTHAVVVNPELASYLRDEGFVSEKGGGEFQSFIPPKASEQTWDDISYKLEAYEKHIELVLKAFEELALPELEYPARALEKRAGWAEGSMLRAAWLCCLLHDVGKLSVGWQKWARAYQKEIGNAMKTNFAAAHTDWNPKNPEHQAADKKIRRVSPKPPHATQSVFATDKLFVQLFGAEMEHLIRAMWTAIARHHAPFTLECEAYTLEPQAAEHIRATFDYVPCEMQRGLDLKWLKPKLASKQGVAVIEPKDENGWLAYLLLVRALRRADQRGTELGSH